MANETSTVTEVPKLDPKVKKRWVAALTSGKFKQTKGVLRSVAVKGKDVGKPTSFCCLGVLTELFRTSKANTEKYKWSNLMDYLYDKDGHETEVPAGSSDFQDESSMTPTCVCEWSKMDDINGDPKISIDHLWKIAKYKAKLKKASIKKSGSKGFGTTTLSELNDAGFTFKEIASIIDTYL